MSAQEDGVSPLEVVRALTVAERWDSPAVGMVTVHSDEIHGGLARTLLHLAKGSGVDPTGLIAAASAGCGYIAATIPRDFAPTRAQGRMGRLRQSRLATASFGRNVSFLYDGSRRVEALLFAPHLRLGTSDAWARTLRDMSFCVSSVAVECRAPILFMYGPSAPPIDVSLLGGQPQQGLSFPKEWRDHQGPALRFSVALSRTNEEEDLAFRRMLIEAALDMRWALYFRRPNGDRRGPGWELIVAAQPSDPGPPLIPGATYISLTAIGAARVGSTNELLKLANHLGLGLMSVAVTSLEGLALIHALLRVPPAVADNRADRNSGQPPRILEFASLREAISSLTENFGVVVPNGYEDVSYPKLSGYRFFVTPANASTQVAGAQLKPIWLAWRTPRLPNAMLDAIGTMNDAIQRELEAPASPVVDFLICRETREDWFRGRCKIHVPVHLLKGVSVIDSRAPDAVLKSKQEIGAWCARVERSWRANLVSVLGSPWVETEVAWRERWIGRLDSFISIR